MPFVRQDKSPVFGLHPTEKHYENIKREAFASMVVFSLTPQTISPAKVTSRLGNQLVVSVTEDIWCLGTIAEGEHHRQNEVGRTKQVGTSQERIPCCTPCL